MPQPQTQVPPQRTFELNPLPGIQRDGTPFASRRWTDGQWVRFQRGKPKKMGGYKAMTTIATGPMRKILIDARIGAYTAHLFSPFGIERLQFDPTSGVGGGISERTPAGYTPSAINTWQADLLVNTGGSPAYIVCSATPDMTDISSDTLGNLYYGDSTLLNQFVQITSSSTPLQVSGGICAIPPFVFIYGSNGLIQNSNPNNISDATGWLIGSGANIYANTAFVTDKKVVAGLPLRGGSAAPAGLFWSLDSLLRVTFQAGGVVNNFWRYDTISKKTSVLSKSGIIEYDGLYYWVGVDRFFVYNGVVQELPNDTNLNYFFDNLNYAQRQKVWVSKFPRYGEIWWFYPSGTNTECNKAVIYNVRENCWYDAVLARTCGAEADIFPSPILCGGENIVNTQYFTYTATTGVVNVNDTITFSSGATATVYRVLPGALNIINISGTPLNTNTFTCSPSGATGTVTSVPTAMEVDPVWLHEQQTDKTLLQTVTAIDSFVTSHYMNFNEGGAQPGPEGVDVQTRIVRLEPDFTSLGALGRATGAMTVTYLGASWPNSAAGTALDGTQESVTYPFDQTTNKIDSRFQAKQMAVKFESNTLGGFYEMGKIMITMQMGDGRG